MKYRHSIFSIELFKQIKKVIESGANYKVLEPFDGMYKEASFTIRVTESGAIKASAKRPLKANWTSYYTVGTFGRRAGCSDQSLKNLSAQLIAYALENYHLVGKVNDLYDSVEDLAQEDLEKIEALAIQKGFETVYDIMTEDDVIGIQEILNNILKQKV